MILLTTKSHEKKMLRPLQALQHENWIDDDTRAVFVEFTVFNPTTRLFVTATLGFEFVSFGTVEPHSNIATLHLYSLTNVKSRPVIVCEVIYLVFLIWYTVHVVNSAWNLRRQLQKYFSNIWTFADLGVVLCAYLAVVIFVLRVNAVQNTLAKAKVSKGEAFVSFYPAIRWERLLTYVFGVMLTLLMINILKLSSFVSKRHVVFTTAMSGIGLSVVSVTFLCTATFLLTLVMSMIQFNDSCGGYSSVSQAVIRTLKLYMYDMRDSANRCVNDTPYTDLVFFGVMFCIAMLWRPLLILSGMILSFTSGKKQNVQLQEDADFVDFLWSRFLVFIGYWGLADYTMHVEDGQARRASFCRRNATLQYAPMSSRHPRLSTLPKP